MSKKEREKGKRVERLIVNTHKKLGVQAQRVPMSGASEYTHDADVDIYAFGPDAAPLVSEVKGRALSNWKTITKWLGENELLFLKEDGMDPLVVMPWRVWEQILEKLKHGHRTGS